MNNVSSDTKVISSCNRSFDLFFSTYWYYFLAVRKMKDDFDGRSSRGEVMAFSSPSTRFNQGRGETASALSGEKTREKVPAALSLHSVSTPCFRRKRLGGKPGLQTRREGNKGRNGSPHPQSSSRT